jgi:hypothetical protein
MSDHDPRIEKIARAICASLDENPDKLVSIAAHFAPGGRTKNVAGPQWHKHIRKAQIHIAAHDALNADA